MLKQNNEKIKCEFCNKLFSKKGIHTHIDRTHGSQELKNKYSSGNNGKYSIISENVRTKYYLNPKHCLHCGEVIPYNKKNNTFCSRSCGAKYNNEKVHSELRKLKETFIKVPRKIRPILHLTCEVCATEFTSKELKKTCGPLCRKLHPNCGGKRNSHNFHTVDSYGNSVVLESSYEKKCATILNNLQIMWLRPKFMFYFDVNNVKRRYFPDFYLPDYNVYLDPKNDYLIDIDSSKLELVRSQNNVDIKIISKNQLNNDSILQILSS